jgi:translation initiation factor IF-2
MAKLRVHELAKKAGITSKEMLALLQKAGLEVKTASSGVSDEVAEKVMKAVNRPIGERAASAAQAQGGGKTQGTNRTPPSRGYSAGPNDSAPRRGGPPMRPTGPVPGGSAGGGKMRRVVIDSGPARRGPGGPPQGGPGPKRRGGRRRKPVFEEPVDAPVEPVVEDKTVRINSGATVKEVSESLGVSSAEVIKKLMGLGEMASLTQTLSDETISVLVGEFDRELDLHTVADDGDTLPDAQDAAEDLVERPPVVTIMGHVDHGKTSLLDAVREADVVAGEAGGITQHIGAYQVHRGEKLITFIDTPGHEAFTAMRARGAEVTDIAVIVVAADDGVMPQTEEAIDHAKAAGVPIVIAVNKIDKEGADPTRVRTELAALGLQPEDWGGSTIFCDVSAKKREGLENLLDMLLLVAEVEELKGNPDSEASGTVIESQLDPGRGPVATLLLQRGRLNIGDAVVAGSTWGRVRAMHDYNGHRIELAELGAPVEVLGFDGVPEAGNNFRVVESDRAARTQAADRANRLKTEAIARRARLKVSFEDAFAQAQEGELNQLNLILKGDVAGSVGALEDEIAKLPQTEIKVNVIHHGVGGINESDIMLASASDAVVIGFNVRPVGDARLIADREGVEIRTYTVIYKAIDELRAAMQGLLAPEEVEETIGQVTVRQTFKASKIGTIAGCHVDSGKVVRGASVRLVRDGTVVHEGKIGTLRRFDDDVREVTAGMECGIVLENYADVKEDDTIEVYETKSVARELV